MDNQFSEAKLPQRVEAVNPFLVMDVLDRAKALEREGREIIHLEIGEPDFDTPAKIRQAGIAALQEGETHYTHSMGILELRQAVCQWYRRHYRVELEPDQVLITMGTSPGLLLVLSAVLNPGDEVILSDPGYA
ncbi:MAG TPA: aminotransferase class I/II-fold pyridoxal phosphate-dependent enzyme, partial [Bacteroidetes bacterium]|nr:aminotransferase class I/II-fold pyridoxal phosphate-dependent enzyme [Bacteroidota bacterium]